MIATRRHRKHKRHKRIHVEPTDALTTTEYKAQLEKDRCDYRELHVYPFDLHATAELSGTVVNPLGQPVVNGFVRLLNEDSERYKFVRTKADGSFKFEGVAAGDYFLALS